MYGNLLTWHQRGRLWMRLGIRFVLLLLSVFFLTKVLPGLLSLFAPFVGALILAAALNPLVRRAQRVFGWSRRALSLAVLLLLAAVLGGITALIVYYGGAELRSLTQNWRQLLESAQRQADRVEVLFSKALTLVPEQVTETVRSAGDGLVDWLEETVSALAASAAARVRDSAMALPALVLALVVFLMASYFLTADYPYLRTRLIGWLDEGVLDFMGRVRAAAVAAFGGYLRAQFLLSVGVFGILSVSFILMRQPYALLLALALSVLDFIPIVGSGTVLVPWAVVTLILGSYADAAVIMLIWGLVVLFRRLAEPKIVGDQTGLSPALSLLSIYAGMKLAGVLGMILGPILMMVLLNLAGIGIFRGVRRDFWAAVSDLAAILRQRPDVDGVPEREK